MNLRVPIIAFAGWGILSSVGSVALAVPVQVTVTGVVCVDPKHRRCAYGVRGTDRV